MLDPRFFIITINLLHLIMFIKGEENLAEGLCGNVGFEERSE